MEPAKLSLETASKVSMACSQNVLSYLILFAVTILLSKAELKTPWEDTECHALHEGIIPANF